MHATSTRQQKLIMICTSIINYSFNDCLDILNNSELVELRLETLDLKPSEFETLCNHTTPKIATCRPYKLPIEICKATLVSAIKNGANYVDIEVESSHRYKKEIIEIAEEHGCKVIISYHNYSNTNQLEILEAIATAQEYSPYLIKIATAANNKKEASLLLGLYNQFDNILAIGMGDQGIITRIAATQLGAPFTFAAADVKEKSAPGQLTKSQMEAINKIINE